MAPQPPQTLSVKRKRNEAPVDSLIVDAQSTKRQKFAWRLQIKPGAPVPPIDQPLSPSTGQPSRRFHVEYTKGQRVLVEAPASTDGLAAIATASTAPVETLPDAAPTAVPAVPRPRKLPSSRALLGSSKTTDAAEAPSDEQVRQFEQFSLEVEQDEADKSKPPPSPLKYLPTGPGRRLKENGKATDAMDLDEYVYDTYVREVIMLDDNGNVPETAGTVGYIVVDEDDEDWWNEEEESDREFATDDEDENAEDYYANDYPEDEMSSDDEFGRDPYQVKYRHGSDDEEYDLNEDSDDDVQAHSGDEDDAHFKALSGTAKAAAWDRFGKV